MVGRKHGRQKACKRKHGRQEAKYAESIVRRKLVKGSMVCMKHGRQKA